MITIFLPPRGERAYCYHYELLKLNSLEEFKRYLHYHGIDRSSVTAIEHCPYSDTALNKWVHPVSRNVFHGNTKAYARAKGTMAKLLGMTETEADKFLKCHLKFEMDTTMEEFSKVIKY